MNKNNNNSLIFFCSFVKSNISDLLFLKNCSYCKLIKSLSFIEIASAHVTSLSAFEITIGYLKLISLTLCSPDRNYFEIIQIDDDTYLHDTCLKNHHFYYAFKFVSTFR